MKQVELSIIVPILNESAQLQDFLDNLQSQQRVGFEVFFVDGGSGDGGPELLQKHAEQFDFQTHLIDSPAGRGRQMNLAVRQVKSDWLIFLHVDSRFGEPLALRLGLDALQRTGSQNVAGHFALSFRQTEQKPSVGYYYYEWKARLNRPETIHGDQGFLLRREFYLKLGGFREDMTVMEDTDFAERIRDLGQWQLLPAGISTSARRFEVEGLWQRQLLGALIMCFRDIGWEQFFREAPNIYRRQSNVDKLQVLPFVQLIKQLFKKMGRKNAWKIWRDAGGYVRRHAWQLTFALDARLAFRKGVPVGQGKMSLTNLFEPVFDFLTDNPAGRFVATLLLRIWFFMTRIWLTFKERGSSLR